MGLFALYIPLYGQPYQPVPSPDTCAWQVLVPADSSLPVARHEAAYVKVGDKHYLLGGRRIEPVSIFDPARKTWTLGSPPPIELHHFQPVVYQGKIWIGGALTGPYPGETPITHFYLYDPQKDEWETGPEIPASRRRGSTGTVVYQDKIYLAAGIGDGHRGDHKTWLDEYDPQTNTWTALADAPRARDHFQATVAEGKLYLIGGRRSAAPSNVFGDTEGMVDVYDFETNTWTTLDQQLPTPRAGCFSVLYGEEILTIGGESGDTNKAHAEVEALHIHQHTFRAWEPLEKGRHGTGVILDHGGLFIASGNGKRGGGNELLEQEYVVPAAPVQQWKREDLYMRDPFILANEADQTYYLYAGTDEPWETPTLTQGVVVYRSKDLETWEGPLPVFGISPDSWADPWNEVWAPEVHPYQGKYYLFSTQANPAHKLEEKPGRPAQYLRATAIAVADGPMGPFLPVASQPATPMDWMSLDGTLWVEKGKPYMVFCHEWHQITDGTFELTQLTEDLTARKGKTKTLFSSSQAPWAREMTSLGFPVYGWVSDGPWLHKTPSGELLMLWSTFGENRYGVGVARSSSGKIKGPWMLDPEPLFSGDGGHCMMFRRFDGQLMLACHAPNRNPLCRTVLREVIETETGLSLREYQAGK